MTRNLLEHPITKEEAAECLNRMCDKAVADDEMAMRCGNLDSYILRCAANLILASDHLFQVYFNLTPEKGDG